MVSAPSLRRYTVAELLEMPSPAVGHYELEEGRLILVAGTSSRPAIVAMNVGAEIRQFARRHDLGVTGGADWAFVLATDPDTVRIPDVGFVTKARIPATGIPAGFWPGAPNLAVEVLSPSNVRAAIFKKVGEYLGSGAGLVWVLDPERRSAEVYRPDAPPLVVGADGELSGEDVLPGFTLRLADIWV